MDGKAVPRGIRPILNWRISPARIHPKSGCEASGKPEAGRVRRRCPQAMALRGSLLAGFPQAHTAPMHPSFHSLSAVPDAAWRPLVGLSEAVRRVSKTAILCRLLDYVRTRHPVTNIAVQIQRSCGVPKAAYRGKKRGYQGVGLSDFVAGDLAGIRSTAKTTAGF